METRKNRKLNIAAVFLTLCFVMTQLFFPAQAHAGGQINVDASTMIELNYIYQGDVVPGVQFHLYRIADVSEDGDITLTAPFDKTKAFRSVLSAGEVRDAVDDMASYITDNDIDPMMTGTTDANGTLFFPSTAGNMRTGIYLIIGEDHEYEGALYEIEPMLISLPAMVEESDEWLYSVKVQPKSARYIEPTPPGEPPGEEPPEDPRIPKTGQLWWPVPVLLAAGMMLIIIGMIRSRRAYDDK